MLLQLFEEAILLADDPAEPISINRRFQTRRGYLEVTRPNVFLRYPFALLEIFPSVAAAPGNQGDSRLDHPADPRSSPADR
jgi:[protein-PII] uridylyltransferase